MLSYGGTAVLLCAAMGLVFNARRKRDIKLRASLMLELHPIDQIIKERCPKLMSNKVCDLIKPSVFKIFKYQTAKISLTIFLRIWL